MPRRARWRRVPSPTCSRSASGASPAFASARLDEEGPPARPTAAGAPLLRAVFFTDLRAVGRFAAALRLAFFAGLRVARFLPAPFLMAPFLAAAFCVARFLGVAFFAPPFLAVARFFVT